MAKSAPRPVVLLHGIDDTSVLFSRLRPFLEKQGREVHVFDMVPNNGAAGMDALAQQVSSYIAKTIRDKVFIDLVGFSMGGITFRGSGD